MTTHTIPSYIDRFERFGIGLFLHWGLYSLQDSGEWILHHHRQDKDRYRTLTRNFKAEDFDPVSLVSWAKENGIRYICLTTRHHDGFSLYDTRGLNTYDAPHSAAKRDLIAEYAQACHDLDMPMFFYHTTLDWNAEAFDTDWEGYLQYLRDSVEVLCKFYGPVAGFWFDGNWSRPDRDWQEEQLYELIRSYHPECIIVNNTGLDARGAKGNNQIDVLTFEQGRPQPAEKSEGRYQAREMCDTITSHWGTASLDLSAKRPAQIIESLVACRRYRANYLLNIGPTAGGAIPPYEKALVETLGQWIKTCGRGIYEGKPADIRCHGEDFVLQVGSNYHCFVHDLPITANGHLAERRPNDGWLSLDGNLPTIQRVYWLDNDEELEFVQNSAKQMASFKATPYPYGRQLVVRTAVIETE